jgi:hypothetical protein
VDGGDWVACLEPIATEQAGRQLQASEIARNPVDTRKIDDSRRWFINHRLQAGSQQSEDRLRRTSNGYGQLSAVAPPHYFVAVEHVFDHVLSNQPEKKGLAIPTEIQIGEQTDAGGMNRSVQAESMVGPKEPFTLRKPHPWGGPSHPGEPFHGHDIEAAAVNRIRLTVNVDQSIKIFLIKRRASARRNIETNFPITRRPKIHASAVRTRRLASVAWRRPEIP